MIPSGNQLNDTSEKIQKEESKKVKDINTVSQIADKIINENLVALLELAK